MKYFIATILSKGKREELPIYAEDRKKAQELTKIKSNGILIKIVESTEPLDAQFLRFKNDLLKNIQKKEN